MSGCRYAPHAPSRLPLPRQNSRGLGAVRVQAFAFTLYITIHRWRHDVKAGLTEEDKPKPAKKAAKAD